ncbi:RAMP superfamily CRISPR-associated protein [Actinomyces sp. zg328]|uniref:RAMP superfamily CRISPR-associated protein n=1 Tax=Actinomyces sp. zg328 TaxID=2609287 RepID=UPI00135A0A89|nr:RAMP superfamily CRISPR-associated protein [Actinomyces sp. zg328]
MSITRYEMTIHLVTESPLHSGGIDEVVDRSRPDSERVAVPRRFARDGKGHPVLTGRSVKGAVRAACEEYLHSDAGAAVRKQLGSDWEGLWGTTSSGKPRAATLTFHAVDLAEAAQRKDGSAWKSGTADAPETHPVAQSIALATRTGIAVNRYWGAAGDTALFEHEYIPAGCPLTLTITAQAGRTSTSDKGTQPEADGPEPATESQVEQLFALIIGLLESGRVAFGGRRNAGWGRVRLDADEPTWTLTRSRLGTREDLLTWLGGGENVTSAIDPVDCTESERIRITISWDSPTGILVAEPRPEKKAEDDTPAHKGAKGQADDQQEMIYTEPLRSGPHSTAPFVLPGSSVRGALRSRASRIARTVLAAQQSTPIDDWAERGVHDQLAADPTLVRDLFGSTDRRGALRVLDTLASGQTTLRKVVHNAGDRWTGGVAEGLLYGEKVPDTRWKDLVLELDPRSLPGPVDRRRAAWCLLGLTLAELATGALPLGSRGTRGLGQIHVTRVRVDGGADIVGEPWDFIDPGGDAADRDGAEVVSIASQVLKRLRALMIEPNPDANWTGWSSYLCETKESCRD